MKSFRYESAASRVLFGAGALAETKEEVKTLGMRKALVVSSPDLVPLAEEAALIIGERCAGVHAEAIQHVPIEKVETSLERVRAAQADGLVAVGGGSSIGLAKAIALKTSLPIIAIPTTYAGSEMTPVWGITANGAKTTGRDWVVKPKSVIYDPKLTLSLPVPFSVTSGMNAIAHCVEGLYAENANPIISLMAEEGIRALGSSLPRIVESPADLEVRSQALYGSWLGGTVLGAVGMALHHKLCHVLGGSYNLPHAETHTVVLSYAVAYNARHAPEAMKAVARALGTDETEVAGYLHDLAKSLGAPTSLAQLGMKREDLDEAAERASKNPYYNPRPVTREAIRRLLELAFTGQRPETDLMA